MTINKKEVIEKSPLYIMWLLLVSAVVFSTLNENWLIALIALVTLFLTFLPLLFQKKYKIYISQFFISLIAFMLYASIFLGEANQFYDKFWWWDLLLHGISAIGFGLVGMIVLLLAFGKHRNESSPIMFSIFSFCFAVCVGVIWEIFEFSMDQTFGLNMQKSGLMDTMTDLIIDCIGAGIASFAGYFYLTSKNKNFFSEIIERNYIGNKALSKRNE